MGKGENRAGSGPVRAPAEGASGSPRNNAPPPPASPRRPAMAFCLQIFADCRWPGRVFSVSWRGLSSLDAGGENAQASSLLSPKCPTLMASFRLSYLLRALAPKAAALGVGHQHMNLRGCEQLSPSRPWSPKAPSLRTC